MAELYFHRVLITFIIENTAVLKLHKPEIYVMITSEPDIRELILQCIVMKHLFSKQKSGVSVCVLDLGPLVLIQNVLLRFLYTKVFLEDLRQPWVFLNFSATSALVFYKLVSYIKRVYSYL